MSDATHLATWIRTRLGDPVTHLKLQKLCFYCYGAALASDRTDVGRVVFEAWEHGPVNREVWAEYKQYGSSSIDPPAAEGECTYSPETTIELDAVLAVYGRLSAWQIRQETHLEEPWVKARAAGRLLDTEEIRAHFRAKFYAGKVALPENLLFASSLSIDNIPAHTFATLSEAAAALSDR